MEIITIEMLKAGVESFFSTFSSLKDAFASAIINNFLESFSHLHELSLYWVLALIGSAVLIWRLKSWVIGFLARSLT